MDYIGSKEKLNDWLFGVMTAGINPGEMTFLDACAGSGAVSKYAAKIGFAKVISNDIMEFPSHIVQGSVGLPKSLSKNAHSSIEELNNTIPLKGFFYNNYSENAGRLYFSDNNASKIDSCRNYISNAHTEMKSYLLYCLLDAMSRVSNTTGVQAAFLKSLKERAKQDLVVRSLPSLNKIDVVHTYNQDISKLLSNMDFINIYKEDILYIDPPYNHRQYAPNYHLYETLVKNDNPKLHGKTGLRSWEMAKSDFCSKKKCISFTRNIVDKTRASIVYISYSSDGIMSIEDLEKEFRDLNIEIFDRVQKRYKSDGSNTKKYNTSILKEYLIKITKEKNGIR